jgi:RNA polymerase sigma factor (sigma-70 family)
VLLIKLFACLSVQLIMKIVEKDIPDLIRQQKDKLVFAHLYKEVFPVVQNYIRKNRGIVDDAHDVFQDALMYFYKQVTNDAFDDKYTVYGYLYRISINRWINKINKDKKMVLGTEIEEHFAKDFSFVESAENISGDGASTTILKKFVNFLGDKCEELLSLRIYSNMMFEDIVLRMDLTSEASAKMQFKRCREKLIQVIKENPGLEKQLRQYG